MNVFVHNIASIMIAITILSIILYHGCYLFRFLFSEINTDGSLKDEDR